MSTAESEEGPRLHEGPGPRLVTPGLLRGGALLAAVVALFGCFQDLRSPGLNDSTFSDSRESQSWPEPLRNLALRARDRFDAPTVSPTDLDLGQWTVVDVREARETAVSRLVGAHLLPTDEDRQRFLDDALTDPPERPVLVYCTAGWRSAEYTAALHRAGVKAFNLEGGICAWAAGNRDIQTPEGETTLCIHAYSDEFADCVPSSHVPVTDQP